MGCDRWLRRSAMRWAILGYAGVLQCFDIQLLGARREALLTPNASFPGAMWSIGRLPREASCRTKRTLPRQGLDLRGRHEG